MAVITPKIFEIISKHLGETNYAVYRSSEEHQWLRKS